MKVYCITARTLVGAGAIAYLRAGVRASPWRIKMNGLILDVIVVVIAVLFIIFGIWRGMYKLIFGLISNLAALVLAIVLATTVTSFLIEKTNIDDYVTKWLDEPIQNALPETLDASGVYITIQPDGTYSVSHNADTFDTIEEYLTSTQEGTMATIYGTVGKLIERIVTNESTLKVVQPDYGVENGKAVDITLAQIISTSAIVYIMLAAVFILLWIIAYILVRIVMYLIKKLVRGTHIGYFFDKVLGMVVGAAFAMIIIWGALAIIRLLGAYTWIIPVNELIESSTITKLLYENNYIYNFLVESSNLQQSIADLLGSFTSGSSEEQTAETAARFLSDAGSAALL